MGRQEWISKVRRLAVLPAAIIMLSFFVYFQLAKRKMPAGIRRLETPNVVMRSPDIRDPENDLSSVLLIDSILSIVQSYYVDDDRVDNNGVLHLTLDSLESTNQIKITRQGTEFSAAAGKATYHFSVPDNLPYDGMLEIIIALSRLLDQEKVGQANEENSSRERNGVYMVLNALLGTLDAHSALLSKDSYRELKQGTEGTFGGLGVLVGIRDKILTVIKPLPRSPASRSGIHRHDRILSINGADTFGATLDHLVEYMRGEPGTSVKLKMLPLGAISDHEMELRREIIRVDSVSASEHKITGGKILKLVIENFSSRTARDVLAEVIKFRQANGGKVLGLVLDLRSNPGGLLDQAVQVADIFLQSGVIVATKGRRQEIESAGIGVDEVNFPLVVLMNGDSASASEIVAGALQDHGRALVIGQQSFGKGSVQTVFELPGEQALKLTIARYYTPSGRSIQNVGITPNIRIQPLFSSKNNTNLLGPYRYKNEEFLANHLKSQTSKNSVRDTEEKIEQFSGYYLAEATDSDEEIPVDKDRDLEIAIAIFDRVNRTYGPVLPTEAMRASHWLALAADDIKKKLDPWNTEVEAFLFENYGIAWKSDQSEYQAGITFDVSGAAKHKITAGSTVNIDYSIRNSTDTPVGHVSLFMRQDGMAVEAKELLIGEVKPHSSKVGVFTFEIPVYCPAGELSLDFGIAVSAKMAMVPTHRVRIVVADRETPQLDLSAKLTDETGGRIIGSLEPKEKGVLAVDIQNTGTVPSHNVAVQLSNLSGGQIVIDQSPKVVAVINAGDHATVGFGISAGARLYTPEISIGVSASSKDLDSEVNKKFDFPALPARMAKIGNSMSH
jgi:carboxyl-terminal processing protease